MVWFYKGNKELDARYFDPLDTFALLKAIRQQGFDSLHLQDKENIASPTIRNPFSLYVESVVSKLDIGKFHSALLNAWQTKTKNRSLEIVDTTESITEDG